MTLKDARPHIAGARTNASQMEAALARAIETDNAREVKDLLSGVDRNLDEIGRAVWRARKRLDNPGEHDEETG